MWGGIFAFSATIAFSATMVTLMTIHTGKKSNVGFEETRTVVVKFAIDTILSPPPPYIRDIWERPPAEGRSALSPAHFLGSCAKGKNGDPRWGDGQGSCKL